MLLTTDSCVDNFIKVKWAPWQTDTTVKESKKKHREEAQREREGDGGELEWTWDANLVLYSFLTVQDNDDVGDDR